MNFSEIARNAQRVIVQNSPLILTSVAVAGVISTTVAAVIVTPEAVRRLDEARHAHDEDINHDFEEQIEHQLTKLEAFKVAAPCYIPAALIGGATVAAIIFSHRIESRRTAAVISAYTIVEKAYDEYRTKNVEINGANADRKAHEAAVAKQLEESPRSSAEIIILNGPKHLFHDQYTGRYFESTINAVEKAVNDVNRLCNEQNYVSLSEFYSMLGLDSFAEVGDSVGWTADHHLETNITTFVAENDVPAFSLEFRKKPIATFMTFR